MHANVVYAIQPDVIERRELRARQKEVQKGKMIKYKRADKVGDHILQDPKEIIEHAKLQGFEGVLVAMNKHLRDAEVQARGCTALAEYASFGTRDKYERKKGIYAEDSDTLLDLDKTAIVALGRKNVFPAVLNAVVKHRNEKRVVLKAAWCLEYLLRCPENVEIFENQGGPSVMQTCLDMFPEDDTIKLAVAKVKLLQANNGELPKGGCCCVQ